MRTEFHIGNVQVLRLEPEDKKMDIAITCKPCSCETNDEKQILIDFSVNRTLYYLWSEGWLTNMPIGWNCRAKLIPALT